jgi:formiminotetrahydrofolate cyclodeaminase
LLTVIELTLAPERPKKYAQCSEEFEQIRSHVKEVIGPRLEELFTEDAIQFDKTIQKRQERNSAPSQQQRNQLREVALAELKLSTELPIEIANLCIQLANYAIVVFDKGFRSARGDSGVALSNALAGLTGCLAIISLNLQSFPKNSWTEEIKRNRALLRKQYERLDFENIKLHDILEAEADVKNDFLAEFIEIRKMFLGKKGLTNSDIESLARRIQNALWKYRDVIWQENPPESVMGVLKPEKVIELLKYAYRRVDTLGVNDTNDEIAGIINNQEFTIQISTILETKWFSGFY